MARKLTNLECVALAHLWKMQPCTGHELRMAFASSSAGRYSGSAGAIYPLLRRLEKRGYITSKPDRNGEQRKRNYSINRLGLRAVHDWISNLDTRDIWADDPIKTRFQYVRILSDKQRAEWFKNAMACVDEQDEMIKAEYQSAEYDNEIDKMVMKGVLEANRVRRRWLKKAEEMLTTVKVI